MKAGGRLTVERMVELGRVSRSGFYRFDDDNPGPDPDNDLRDAIQKIAVEWPSYGRPRMTKQLREPLCIRVLAYEPWPFSEVVLFRVVHLTCRILSPGPCDLLFGRRSTSTTLFTFPSASTTCTSGRRVESTP